MRPDKLFLPVFLIALLSLAGCEQAEPPVNISSRPVKTLVVGETDTGDTRTFPAVVDAIQKADISFRVSGKIIRIHVKQGDTVKKDQLLAELDPTDFEITLKDRQASYDTAKANYDRAVELLKKGAISKADHDRLRASYFTAKANLDEAKQNLRYTKLKASFAGHIAKRYVENFEEVLASQAVFALEDISTLKIKIDVPENLMIAARKASDEERQFYAVFDSIPGQKFPLHFLETTTTADPKTKTFRVTLTMTPPENYNILPGMTTSVFVKLLKSESRHDETREHSTTLLPVSAVVANSSKQPVAWIVDEKTMTVHAREVTPGQLTGKQIQVQGLQPGDRVVVAGAAFLREGMKVTLLQTGDQPR